MTKTLNITNFEAINIVAFYNQLTQEKLDALPQKTAWWLLRAVKKIQPDVKDFEDFRNDKIKAVQEEYFGEEKSIETAVTKLDENGNPVLDESGAEMTEPGRKVKKEYEEEYQAAIEKLNTDIQEILMEKNEYVVNTVNMDDVVEALPDNNALTTQDLQMIDAIIGEA